MKTTNGTPETKETESGGSLLGHIWSSLAATVILTVICCGIYPLVVWGVAQTVFANKANGSLVKKDGTPTTNPSEAVGSSLIGQGFSGAGYFQPRPSAAGNGYDPTASGGTNLGPLSDKLINGVANPATQPTTPIYDGIRLRAIHYAVDNSIAFKLFAVAPDGSKMQVPLTKYQDARSNLLDEALVEAFPHPTSDDDSKLTHVIAGEFATLIPSDAVTASASGLDPHISPDNAEIQKARVAAARNIKPEQVEELIKAHTDGPDLGILGDAGVNVLMLNIALDAKYPVPATQPAGKQSQISLLPKEE